MRRSLLLIAVAALPLAACGQEPAAPAAEPAATPPPAAETPAPGQDGVLTAEGYGPLRIGMTRAEVEQALGPDADPDSVGGPDPKSCDIFRPERAPENMMVMVEQGVLTSIWLDPGSEVNTDRGFGPGDGAAAVKAAYGDAAQASPHKYSPAPAEYVTVWARGGGADYVQDANARGISYHIGTDGNVEHVAAGGPSIQYVEGCA